MAVLTGVAPMMYTAGGLYGKPICRDQFNPVSNHNLPVTFLPEAKWVSAFAAHYGIPPNTGYPTDFSNYLLNHYIVSSPDHAALGKASVGFMEIANETDNAWSEGLSVTVQGNALNTSNLTSAGKPTRYYYSPEQYATMLSCAYDGNLKHPDFAIKNANGQTIGHWGIKNLSQGMKVVMAGTADLRKDYLDLMVTRWAQLRPDMSIPVDIINYHFYPTTSHPPIDGSSPSGGTWDQFFRGRRYFDANGDGQYPEASNIDLRTRILRTMDEQPVPLRTIPVWITEFGYDSHPTAASGSNVQSQLQQAQWLTRYILEASSVMSANGRYVEKLHIYELNDDPTQTQFGSSGLKGTGGPKKSWYHIRTMLSVLGVEKFKGTNGSIYNHEFYKSGASQPEPVDNPRIYTYERLMNKPTIALWLPSGINTTLSGDLLLKGSSIGSTSVKPLIQLITVVEGDEDGKREMIDPSRIVQQGNNWLVKGLKITETPIYLRINQSLMKDDPIVKPLTNLAASCRGCATIAQVTWTIPTGANYSFYRVYQSDCSVTTFDLGKVQLVAEYLPGNATSAYVNDVSTSSCTKVWIVPFVSTLNSENGYSYAMGGVQAVQYQPTNCQTDPCISNHGGQVSVTIAPPSSQILGTPAGLFNTTGNICDQLANSPGAGIELYGGAKLQFEVNFQNSQFINLMHLFYGTGAARITIEIKEDCCTNYTMSFQFDVNASAAGGINQWLSFSNAALNQKRIERMRITIESQTHNSNGQASTGFSLKRMWFCTTPAPEVCPQDELVTPPVDELTTVNQLETVAINEINTHSAVVEWNSVMQQKGQELPTAVGGYLVKYSTAKDVNGNLVQPETVAIEGEPFDGGLNSITLTPLAPNTTYHVQVMPDPIFVSCIKPTPGGLDPMKGVQLSFKTLDLDEVPLGRLQSNSNQPNWNEPPTMTIYPNPTHGHLQIELGEIGVYSNYIVHTVNGIRKQEGVLDSNARNQRIDLTKLPTGLYLLTLSGSTVRPQTQTFMLMNED